LAAVGLKVAVDGTGVVVGRIGVEFGETSVGVGGANLQDRKAKVLARALLETLKKGRSKITKSGSSLWTKPS
jgi:hypothetical protein